MVKVPLDRPAPSTQTQFGVQTSSTNGFAQAAFTTDPTAGHVYMMRATGSNSFPGDTLVDDVTFDPVNLANTTNNQFSMRVFIANDGTARSAHQSLFGAVAGGVAVTRSE